MNTNSSKNIKIHQPINHENYDIYHQVNTKNNSNYKLHHTHNLKDSYESVCGFWEKIRQSNSNLQNSSSEEVDSD